MIVVTKVETIECDQDDFYTYADMPKIEIRRHAGLKAVEKSYELESIRGMTFVKMNKDVVVIGMSKQAQEAIGLPLEAFDTLQREKDEIQGDLADTTKAKWEMEKRLIDTLSIVEHMVTKLADLKGAGLWQRIKWVFTGVNHDG